MTIQDAHLKFTNASAIRKKTDVIMLHHAESAKCTVEDIHRWHQDGNGWSGIGYHYFVRKDGSIWRGRPEEQQGAHAGSKNGYNTHSVGICFEGKYNDIDKVMPTAQYNAGVELVRYLLDKYKGSKVLTHKDVSPTSCPGQYFPVAQFKALSASAPTGRTLSGDLDVLAKQGIINSPQYWLHNAIEGGMVKGDYAAGLIQNVVDYMNKRD